MTDLLKGIRVLDLGRFISAPLCSLYFAQLGAEVIKVEKAGEGDTSRNSGPFTPEGSSIYFPVYNYDKKSVTVDFRSEKGKEVLRRLIAVSDVIVDNFKAGTMDRMGFSYDEMSRINPRIIHISITGFGQTGPDAGRPAFDSIVSMRAGLYREMGDGTIWTPELVTDTMSGQTAAIAVMAALYERERTGKGQRIDFSMLTCAAASRVLPAANAYLHNGEPFAIIDAPNGDLPAKDGVYRIICGPQSMFLKMRELVNDPLFMEEKYLDMKNRIRDQDLLLEHLSRWTKQKTCSELDDILAENGITGGKAGSFAELPHDRQLNWRGDVEFTSYMGSSSMPIYKFPAQFSDHPAEPERTAPTLGADNREILTQLLGFREDEVEEYTR